MLLCRGLVCVSASFPLLLRLRQMNMGINLSSSESGLGHTEVMRGGYMNSGSQDIGPDPDWDHKTGTWKGKLGRQQLD